MKLWVPRKHRTLQPDAVLTQPNPNQNEWYPVIDTTGLLYVIGIAAAMTLVEETCEIRVTMDGRTFTYSFTATPGKTYHANLSPNTSGLALYVSSTSITVARDLLMECRQLKVEIRKTSAAGAGDLMCCVSLQRG